MFQFVLIASCPHLIISLTMYFIYKCYKCYLGNFKPVKCLHQYLTTGCLEIIKNRVVKDMEQHEIMEHSQYGVYQEKHLSLSPRDEL